MHNTKTDRRVKYTKLALRQSLMELLEKKNINKITVKEICERADINRGTFYSHYKDAYDLMNQIEDELRTEVEQTIAKHQTQAMFTLDFIHEIIESIYVNRDLCKVLLGENGDIAFIKKIIYIAHDRFIEQCKEIYDEKSDEYYEYYYEFVVNGCIGIIRRWVNNGFSESPDFISNLILYLAANAINGWNLILI